jgi:hypothetical protein
MEVYLQLVRGEITERGSEDFENEYLDKYHQSIFDDVSIELKLLGSSV